jgi:hypothetical protein
MSLDEPTMLGPTPEERASARRRTKRIRTVVAVAAVVIVAIIGVSLIPEPASSTVYFEPLASSCAGGANFTCSFVLGTKSGSTIAASDIKNILVNGSEPTYTAQAQGNAVSVHLSLPSVNMVRGLPDVGPSARPPSVGQVVVYLTDGTTVSDLIGPSGIVVPGHPGP